MKNKLLYVGLSVIALSLLLFSSCKNDLEVLAPGEESVSVYGVLNPNAAVQNIRINKVYLTKDDALLAGQDGSTINYDTSELRVTLQRFMPGSTTPTLTSVGIPLKKEIVLTGTFVTTANGTFNANQTIWQTADKLYSTGEYKLNIKIKSSGKDITAQTAMSDSVKTYNAMPFIYIPNPSSPANAFPMHCGYVYDSPPGTGTKRAAYVNYAITTINQKIRFKSVANARLYEVIMRFHYLDLRNSNNDTTAEYVDFKFSTLKSAGINGGEIMEVSFFADEFYKNLAAEIPKKQSAGVQTRVSHYMEYIVSGGSESLNTFLQVNAPSTSIAQDKPNYTNIDGGIGVFGSKTKSTITKDLLDDFINEIADNAATNNLLFNKSNTFICR